MNRNRLLQALLILVASLLLHYVLPAKAELLAQEAEATLLIVNESRQTVCYLLIASSTDNEWGEDVLGNNKIIPGSNYPLNLASGNYDILLANCESDVLQVRRNLAISGQYELRLTEADVARAECDSYSQQGIQAYSSGEYIDALKQFEAADTCYKNIDDHIGESNTLNNIAVIYTQQGRYGEALNTYHQVLTIVQQVGDRVAEGAIFNNIADIYATQGRYTEALDIYEQALGIAREVNDRVAESGTLNNIGGVYAAQGRYDKALESYQQALIIQREVGDRASEGRTLSNLGGIYNAQRRYDDALESYQQALAILRTVGDRTNESRTLSNLGSVYTNQRRYDDALESYQQALTIQREVGDRASEGRTLSNLGSVYNDQGYYDDALESYQQALTIQREVGDRASEGTTLTNIGLVYSKQERYTEALNAYQQVLVIQRGMGDRVAESATLDNIAGVYYNQSRYEDALVSYQQALTIAQEVDARSTEDDILQKIGLVYEAYERYDEALLAYGQSLAIQREVGNRLSEGMTLHKIGMVYEHQNRYNEALDAYQQAIAIQHELGDHIGEGTTLSKIGMVYEHQNRYNEALDAYQQAMQSFELMHIVSEDATAQAKFLGQFTDVYNRIIDLYLRQDRGADAFFISERGRALSFLNIKDSTSEYNRVLRLNDVQVFLDDQTTLISYWMLRDQTIAFIITANTFNIVELPDASTKNVRKALIDLYIWLNRENPYLRPLRDLYEWLISPLANYVTTPHVTIIPYQLLYQVPFTALTDGTTYFGQRHTLSILPSASSLLYSIQNANHAQGQFANQLLLLGNPTTDDPRLKPSAYSTSEVQAIAGVLNSPIYTATAATEQKLREQIENSTIVHIATKTSYNQFNPLYSFLALAPSENYDGHLEIHEILNLSLVGNDLVTLSACQAEGGDLSQSEELVGIPRAFFYAGAPTILTCLWKEDDWVADDTATEALMVAFYKHWFQEGMSKAEALQIAQNEVRSDPRWGSPYYWAGFVLYGYPSQSAPNKLDATQNQP